MTPEEVMKQCQIGRHNIHEANDLLAECYGTIGKLLNERIKPDERVLSGLILDGGVISSCLTQDFVKKTNIFDVRHDNGDIYRITVSISEIVE